MDQWTFNINHPMPDIPKNTTCPTSNGFKSDSDSRYEALVQGKFLGTFDAKWNDVPSFYIYGRLRHEFNE